MLIYLGVCILFFLILTLPTFDKFYSVIQPFNGDVGSILGALAIGIIVIAGGLICIEYLSLKNHIKLRQMGASSEELDWQSSNCTLKVRTLINRIDDGMDVCKVYIQTRTLEIYGVLFLLMYLFSSYIQGFINTLLCI